jgi:hypothetical protein
MSHRPYSIGIPEQDPLVTTDDHAVLQNVTADQHHAKSHTHDGADGSGVVSYDSLTDQPTEVVEHSNDSHVTTGFPGASAPGDGTQQGSSTSVARLDHQHAREDTIGAFGTRDHDLLTGLTDDDHTQYRLESVDHTHQTTGAEAGQLDHGTALTGLSDDDHPQYALESGSIAVFTTKDHDLLTGLTDDDHTQYALLGGRVTPQQFSFGTASGASTGYFTSTIHATKGKYFLNAAGTITIDDFNLRVGIGLATPLHTVHIQTGSSAGSAEANSALVFESSTHNYLTFLTPNNKKPQILFSDPESTIAGSVAYDHSTNSLILRTNAVENWQITSAGHLTSLISTNYIDLSAIAGGSNAILLAGSHIQLGGGTLLGNSTSAGALTLSSTSHATKGHIYFGSSTGLNYDEAQKFLGIGRVPTTVSLEVNGSTWQNSSGLFDFASANEHQILKIASTDHVRLFFSDTEPKYRIRKGDSTEAFGFAVTTGIFSLMNSAGYIDLSTISAGSPNLKITATSDTPTVAFTGGGNAPTTAPAGYVEILVGATPYYMPFWA